MEDLPKELVQRILEDAIESDPVVAPVVIQFVSHSWKEVKQQLEERKDVAPPAPEEIIGTKWIFEHIEMVEGMFNIFFFLEFDKICNYDLLLRSRPDRRPFGGVGVVEGGKVSLERRNM